MKNLNCLVSRNDVHEACRDLLRSKPFIESYETKGLIFKAIDRYANLPRMMCDYTDHALERSHFSVYYNVVPRRDYGDQAALSDLYYYHEQGHAIVANYQKDQPYSLWVNRLTKEEARTSVLSEMLIYFELPGLRDLVFQDQEIWADRYLKEMVKVSEGKEYRLPEALKNASNHDLFAADKELFTLFAMEKREEIMRSTKPESLDEQERLIWGYGANNFKWNNIWRPVRDKVERAMLILDESSHVDRQMAIDGHYRFLEAEQGNDICPFAQQAREFRQVMIDFHNKNKLGFLDKNETS